MRQQMAAGTKRGKLIFLNSTVIAADICRRPAQLCAGKRPTKGSFIYSKNSIGDQKFWKCYGQT